MVGWLNGAVEGGAVLTTYRLRFETPLYTVAEAARIVGVPSRTLMDWAKGYVRRFPNRPDVSGGPVITFRPPDRLGEPSIPFIGLAEALVLAAVRRSGVPMQRIRPALAQLEKEIGLDHALASRKLFTDGAELLFDYGERQGDTIEGRSAQDLVVVRNGQRVFVDVITEYLQRIQYGADGYPELIRVPTYRHADVVVDPKRAFGAPIFERGAARVEDVLERFWADESMDDLAEEFGVPADQLEDVLRVASRRAA
jgi:uncharacterized protein (DUF433 family)